MNSLRMNEGATGQYTTTILDSDSNPIPGASLASLKITLVDEQTKKNINARDGQNALNANHVTIDGSGNLVWEIQKEDSIIVQTRGRFESHVATFEWVTNAGDVGNDEVFLEVLNLGASIALAKVERIRRRLGGSRRMIELQDEDYYEAMQSALDLFNKYLFHQETQYIPKTAATQMVIRYGDDAVAPDVADPYMRSVWRVSFTRPEEAASSRDDPFTLTSQIQNGGYFGGYRSRRGVMAPAGRMGYGDVLFLKTQREVVERITSHEPDWEWDKSLRQLVLFMPSGPYDITIFKAYSHTFQTIPETYDADFLSAAEGYARLMLADQRGKFGQQQPGPTGPIGNDSAVQLERGNKLIDAVTERLRNLPLTNTIEFG